MVMLELGVAPEVCVGGCGVDLCVLQGCSIWRVFFTRPGVVCDVVVLRGQVPFFGIEFA